MRAMHSLAFASVLLGAVAVLAAPADAACKKFGFTVNDYGKDGPTNDAKNLLDKHISEWAAQNKVTGYTTGKKSVNCELFLDVVLFDEHTCTASATVCWGADAKKLGAEQATAAPEDGSAAAPPAPVKKAHALGHATKQATAPAAAAPAAAAAAEAPAASAASEQPADTAQTEAAPTTPVEQIATPAAETPAAPPAVQTAVPTAPSAPSVGATAGATMETGALQAGQSLPQAVKKPGVSEKDRAAAAAAAASAASAAERAAVAAETAANAAKEAAAAAVAASAASKGSATVPPLNHASSGAQPGHTE